MLHQYSDKIQYFSLLNQIKCLTLHHRSLINNKEMATLKSKKVKDQQANERLFAQSLAQRYPIYEDGRNVVGFLKIMGNELTERITDLLRGHSREMQGEIADSIRIYVLYQIVDLTWLRRIDDELLEIFEMIDNNINKV